MGLACFAANMQVLGGWYAVVLKKAVGLKLAPPGKGVARHPYPGVVGVGCTQGHGDMAWSGWPSVLAAGRVSRERSPEQGKEGGHKSHFLSLRSLFGQRAPGFPVLGQAWQLDLWSHCHAGQGAQPSACFLGRPQEG